MYRINKFYIKDIAWAKNYFLLFLCAFKMSAEYSFTKTFKKLAFVGSLLQ